MQITTENQNSYSSGIASAHGKDGGNTAWLYITWERPEYFIWHPENVLLTFGALWGWVSSEQELHPNEATTFITNRTISSGPNSTLRCAEEKNLWFGG